MSGTYETHNSLQSFWRDERGTIELSSWFFLVVMVALGMIVGMSTLRNEITQQFGDVSQALETLDQSYSYSVNNVTSTYKDTNNLGDPTLFNPPAGMDLEIAGTPE
jgi:Flp pilus assembly pilin Flp